MVQEFKLEEHLLLPVLIKNFDQSKLLFEIDYLSSLDLISEGLQKIPSFVELVNQTMMPYLIKVF